MMVQPTTARRYVAALQFYNNYIESPGGVEPFVVDASANVLESLEIQKQNYQEEKRARNTLADPLENLKTNMLSASDKRKFIRTVLHNNSENWCPLTLTFTGCEQMMMRQDSIKKMRWCDLHMNNTHAPFENNGSDHIDSKMLAAVYMPLEHKERQEAKRVVCVWRHADWEQCFTGAVARVLFYKLNNREIEFNFHRDSMGEAPDWFKEYVIPEWSTAKQAGAAYKTVMNECGISWAKVAHLRKCATEKCGRDGLHSSIIATMTKHRLSGMSVLDLHYTTELHPKALACLLGTKFKDYDVPRTRVNFLVDLDDFNEEGDEELRGLLEPMQNLVRLVFPMYDDLIEQLDSSRADPGESAFQFIEEVMPYLAEVLVQDGVFFTHEFPDHPVSCLLLNRLPPGYP
jgi:hypothetical protein